MKKNVTFETEAYAKIILHAAKYPHAAVNGLLLADNTKARDGAKSQDLCIVDSIPLFHHSHNLAPMAEIALTLVETMAQEENKVIAGYYAACENFRDNTVDKCPSLKIAEKIVEYYAGAVFVVVDNRKVSQHLTSSPLTVHKLNDGKWKQIENDDSIQESKSPYILETVSHLLQAGVHRDLVDFDNHLDESSQDWTNFAIKKLIASINASES